MLTIPSTKIYGKSARGHLHPILPSEAAEGPRLLGVQAAFHGSFQVPSFDEELRGAGEVLQLARQLATLLGSEPVI